MISDPELVDERGRPLDAGSGEGGDGGGGVDLVGSHGDGPGSRGASGRTPWLWALGGALGASVLWAGGLYAYETRGPDLGGYRSVENLCDEAELKGLGTVLGERSTSSPGPDSHHEAVDRMLCDVRFGTPPAEYEVTLMYRLHKKIDPGVEFEAGGDGLWSADEGEALDGLGEMAQYDASPNSANVVVLDGQAELAMMIWSNRGYEGLEDGELPDFAEMDEADPALSGIKEFMVEDMKALMAGLKGR
ncbi:hypothetical protein I3F58_16005 [Streptomyces sp. MUM 203J]|uniref:hypothetical protein n=1 Tax=Streptomyces sp. MUM 203J TaxID=2791990 RepID=UPI001F0421F5|nr:hypothetical protein [Streptomyces sp. MUM 203J]MCH0541045.1 hypothetical protein [Streptomyces sp. MUM 203J]